MGLPRWAEFDDMRLVDEVEQGLPLSAVETIVHRIDPDGSYVRVQDIVPRSTYYRRKDVGRPLNKEQSERILALSKVFHQTLRQYHDDRRTAAMFLARSHPLLGGRSPLEMARGSIAGAELVLKVLARAEAGVAV
jgi:putative toxin-antitoxin system antitoxin component (TIGR02293 family)